MVEAAPSLPNKAANSSSSSSASSVSHETANDASWALSFAAAMVPFTAFCYGHSKGLTVRVVNAVVKSPLGAPGLLLLPFVTLAMEKSIYDTVQAAQGIDPNTRPADRGGFPSGGSELPSFSLIPVQRRTIQSTTPLQRRMTLMVAEAKVEEKL
jgi:hypothetical protein